VFVIDRLGGTGSLTNFRTPLTSSSNSFTEHQTTSGGSSFTFLGCRISSRVLVAGELGTITNLINNSGAGHRAMAVAFRPSSAITSVTYTSTGGQYTTGDPSVQTVTVSAEPAAALAMAVYTVVTGTIAPRTSSITMEELADSGVTAFYAKYKLYGDGESRTNFTVDMDDEGTNLLQSFYVKFN